MGGGEPIIETIEVGPLATNSYLIAAADGADGAVIDPGDDVEKIIAAAERRRLHITHIINTHGHWDHIGAVAALSRHTGAFVYIHADDAEMFGQVGADTIDYEALQDNQVLIIGGVRLEVRFTPGHTRGGISLIAGPDAFVGDLIFAGSIGRTDLPGGDFETLIRSINDRILTLPDNTIIHPGHGPSTTVGIERVSNPYLQQG